MNNGVSITYEYDWSFFIHPSSHPWFSIFEPSTRGWRGFSRPFGISLDVALLWFRSGERSNDERERERERAMAGLSLQCAACKAQFRSVEEAQEHAELTKHADFEESTVPVRVCYCCCFVFFPPTFSCPFWWPICCREHGRDPSLRTFGSVFSILFSAAYQVCRSALLKSFWMDPLSNETYFCSSFVVNSSRLVYGPFFVVVWLILFWSWRRQQQPCWYFSHRQQTVKCFFNSSNCSFLFASSSLTCNAQFDSRRWLLQGIYNLNFFPASISVGEST
jgi:hypothetical protein